jgi:hypothetical protein
MDASMVSIARNIGNGWAQCGTREPSWNRRNWRRRQHTGQPQETPFWPLRLLQASKGEMQVDGPMQPQLKSPLQAFGIEMQCGRGPSCVT